MLVFATYLQNSSQYPIAAKDIETIINRSAEIKKTKTSGQKLTPKQQKELTEKEKEMKSKRKQIHGSI